ncbi:MAG: Holliday junction resolvase RuvX [Acidimicrobiaceae bacterium]|nr:Holliday junction resolvase RuvX [Acidimicrobiaceae bacterium]
MGKGYPPRSTKSGVRVRVIGIDLGSKRIGIALSDSDLTVATPLDVIERSGNVENDHIAILKITDEWEVKRIIVGLPISLDGTLGASAQSVIDEISRLGDLTDIPIETHDERFTTVTAEQILLQQNVKRDKKKRVIDKVAAAIILQGWIDSFNKSKDARSGIVT